MFRRYLPYALDQAGRPILPIAANRLKRSSLRYGYTCPECKSPVQRFAEIGGKQVPHFRHLSATTSTTGCCYGSTAGESATHRRACHDVKAMLLAAFLSKETDGQVEIEATCAIHGKTRRVPWKPATKDVRINQSLPNHKDTNESDSRYRPDIAVYREDGRVDLIIEIRHRHEIAQDKIDYYTSRNFEWIEVLAADVDSIVDRLRARQHGFAMPCCAGLLARESSDRSGIAALSAVVCRRGAVGITPWGGRLEFDGRRWREPKPLDTDTSTLIENVETGTTWSRGPSGHVRRSEPMWRASRAPMKGEWEAKAQIIAESSRLLKNKHTAQATDVKCLLDKAFVDRAQGKSLASQLDEWRHDYRSSDVDVILNLLLGAGIAIRESPHHHLGADTETQPS